MKNYHNKCRSKKYNTAKLLKQAELCTHSYDKDENGFMKRVTEKIIPMG